jgi:hypothetical protein
MGFYRVFLKTKSIRIIGRKEYADVHFDLPSHRDHELLVLFVAQALGLASSQ